METATLASRTSCAFSLPPHISTQLTRLPAFADLFDRPSPHDVVLTSERDAPTNLYLYTSR